jgi:hypothetical protein
MCITDNLVVIKERKLYRYNYVKYKFTFKYTIISLKTLKTTGCCQKTQTVKNCTKYSYNSGAYNLNAYEKYPPTG